jgi:hypothetical protein
MIMIKISFLPKTSPLKDKESKSTSFEFDVRMIYFRNAFNSDKAPFWLGP